MSFRLVVKIVYQFWLSLGEVLSKITTTLFLIIIFFIILTPLAILLRVFGRDPLHLKFSRTPQSYWRSLKEKPPLQMEKQF